MKWISIKDRLPENMDYVLVFGPDPRDGMITGYYKASTKNWIFNMSETDSRGDNPSHWMPLPQPPKE